METSENSKPLKDIDKNSNLFRKNEATTIPICAILNANKHS
jgi:hypothetical protein